MEQKAPRSEREKGTLYVCSTPIGNLEDVTLRALRVLREVALIAAEDTRRTRNLLRHYGIATPITSFHAHNEAEKARYILSRLLAGDDVALVSDAGTPLLSDPGLALVQAAIDAGVHVSPVPGASALMAAAVASGMRLHPLYFGGFLPRQRSERLKALHAVAQLDATLVFYEAPHRLVEALEALAEVFPQRRVAVARELTKVHESVLRGSAQELAAHYAQEPPKGECVVVIEGPVAAESERADPGDDEVLAQLERALEAGMSKKQAIKEVAQKLGVDKRRVYRIAVDLPPERA